jgi:hypothetical protein
MGSIGIAGCDLSHRVSRVERRRKSGQQLNFGDSGVRRDPQDRRRWLVAASGTRRYPEIAGLKPPELPAS